MKAIYFFMLSPMTYFWTPETNPQALNEVICLEQFLIEPCFSYTPSTCLKAYE